MLTLAYNNTAHTDGLGSQLQRLIGIYCVSRTTNTGFLNLGLSKIDYQGLAAVQNNKPHDDLPAKINDLLVMPSNALEMTRYADRIYAEENPALAYLHQFKDFANSRGGPTLLLLTYPFAILDLNPAAYGHAKGLIGKGTIERLKEIDLEAYREIRRPTTETIEISVHVRRGELLLVESQRMLTDNYYIGAIENITKILKALKLPFRISIHSEATNGPITISPKHLRSLNGEKTFDFNADQFKKYQEFENTELRINENPLAALINMATADILIGSRSSFSYVSACAGLNQLSIFPHFWHAAMPNWLEADQETGLFDQILATKLILAHGKYETNPGETRPNWSLNETRNSQRMGV